MVPQTATSAFKQRVPTPARVLKQAAEFHDSTRSLNLDDSEEMDDDEEKHHEQLLQCVTAHKLRERSNIRLFQVKRYEPTGREKRQNLDKAGKLCIACTRLECKHKIFLLQTGLESTTDGWKFEQQRIMEELAKHETKHYVTIAKLVLWIIEAFMNMFVNYYKV